MYERSSVILNALALAATTTLASISLAQTGTGPFVNWETPHVNPIALTPSGNLLLAVNTADNRLEVFDISRGNAQSPSKIRSIAVGLDPVSVRARNNVEAWVVNQISDSISIVDLPTGRVVQTITGTVGDEPSDVVFAGNPQRAFVTISRMNQVRVFDPSNPAAAPTIIDIQGQNPRALATSADGSTVYAAIFESGNKSTLVSQQQVSQGSSPYGGVNPPPNNGNAFLPAMTPGNPTPPPVSIIVKKNANGQWVDGNTTPRNWSNFVTWNLHDHDVAIIDANALTVTYATGMMNMVAGVAVSPAGVIAAVGTDAMNQVRFEPNVDSTFIRCKIGSFSAGTPGNVSFNDINPHLTYAVKTISQAQRDQSIGDPRGIVWHPTANITYVSGMGSNNVIVTDTTGARLGLIDVGQGPTGLAINAAGSRLYVLNKFDGSISTIDTTANTELSRVAFFDPTPSAIKIGRPFLYNTHTTSGLGQASCASCHIDGRGDHLAWDLGDPSGAVTLFNQICQAPPGGGGPTCINWHPMKGPMVTQPLQGIIGNEPFHWRGEKTNLAAFNPAFTNLQARDAQLTANEMQQFENFVATITYPPNPNRNIDNSLKTAMPVTGGTGNATTGRNVFLNAPVLPGGATCVGCHALPIGSNNRIDIPAADPQGRKNAQLRSAYMKTGFDRTSQNNNCGFGYNHDGTMDTLATLLNNSGFALAPGAQGVQQRRDLEAFILSLGVDTHAAVGTQVTIIDGSSATAAQLALINQMLTLANSNAVGLVVKGRQNGIERGYRYNGSNVFQADRSAELITQTTLLASATPGNELTYMLVPAGSQTRIGIDRDSDGFFDRDEVDRCSNPADPLSVPASNALCRADISPPGGNGFVNVDDLLLVINSWGATSGPADIAPGCGNGFVNVDDLLAVVNAWGQCPH